MSSSSGRAAPARKRGALQNFRGVVRSLHRLLFHGGRVVPALFAAIAVLVALRPMLFEPEVRLDGLLASMAGIGLSFASVSLTAANVLRERRRWSAEMVSAGLTLLRYSLAIVVALALSTARRRIAADFSFAPVLDWVVRGAMTLVTAVGIGLGFLGFRSLILLLGPELEPEASSPSAEEPPAR